MCASISMQDGLTRENLHGIVNKAMAAASPFLVEANRTRRPYLPVSPEVVEHFRKIVEEQFSDMLWKG